MSFLDQYDDAVRNKLQRRNYIETAADLEARKWGKLLEIGQSTTWVDIQDSRGIAPVEPMKLSLQLEEVSDMPGISDRLELVGRLPNTSLDTEEYVLGYILGKAGEYGELFLKENGEFVPAESYQKEDKEIFQDLVEKIIEATQNSDAN